MQAIIIGAGRGVRMMPYTSALPKCMLAGFGSRRVLDWILDALSGASITDVTFVGGYQIEAIAQAYPQLRMIKNDHWETNNILASLMCAAAHLQGPVIVSYSDILYERETVKRLVDSTADIALAVDYEWRRAYEGRVLHPEAEAEKVRVVDGRIRIIGKHVDSSEADGEFIGLARLSESAAAALRCRYLELSGCGDLSIQRAPSLQKAYLTDMLQELINMGVAAQPVSVAGFWAEVDTPEDLDRVQRQVGHQAE